MNTNSQDSNTIDILSNIDRNFSQIFSQDNFQNSKLKRTILPSINKHDNMCELIKRLPKCITPWSLMTSAEISDLKSICKLNGEAMGNKVNKVTLCERVYNLYSDGAFGCYLDESSRVVDAIKDVCVKENQSIKKTEETAVEELINSTISNPKAAPIPAALYSPVSYGQSWHFEKVTSTSIYLISNPILFHPVLHRALRFVINFKF